MITRSKIKRTLLAGLVAGLGALAGTMPADAGWRHGGGWGHGGWGHRGWGFHHRRVVRPYAYPARFLALRSRSAIRWSGAS